VSCRRYENLRRLLDLAFALQAPGRGLSLEEMRQRYGVSRKTAARMRDTVRQVFPELRHEPGPDGRRYWTLRRGRANGLVSWSVEEIAALEAAIHWAQHANLPVRERALRSIADKVKGLIAPHPLEDLADAGAPLPCTCAVHRLGAAPGRTEGSAEAVS
jgi:predicted DNA-binding transcriptional regulator YafY